MADHEANPAPFDASSDVQVGLWDEMPLWSALAGELLLELAPLRARAVLDLGCGTGFPLLEIAERLGPGTRAVGVDPWAAALRRACAKRDAWPVPNAALVRGDGAKLPFGDGAFDLVVSNLGVNNFADPAAAFDECRRVLEPGGTLVLSTNLAGHFRELYEAFADVFGRAGDPTALERLRSHIAHRGTVAGIAKTLESHGLHVQGVRERETAWRFSGARALFTHHFMRLGFLDGWRDVAGVRDPERVLAEVRVALEKRAAETGGLRLTVPLAAIVAKRK